MSSEYAIGPYSIRFLLKTVYRDHKISKFETSFSQPMRSIPLVGLDGHLGET
jgi:hypothetical protein